MKVREMSAVDAMKALKEADEKLQKASGAKEKRSAAIIFATAERNARAAQKRAVSSSVLEALK